MPVLMPDEDRLPSGPLRDLNRALHDLYREAGRPGVRAISAGIRSRDDLPDTVSHETVSAMLRGDGLLRWAKLESIVRQLAAHAVSRPDPDAEVRKFHRLWLVASDRADPPVSDLGVSVSPSAESHLQAATKPGRAVSGSLIGRQWHRGQLKTWTADLAAGAGRAVLIEGEPGIGKSSLVRAAAVDAAAAGCQVLWAVCDELSQAFPLLPLLDALEVHVSSAVHTRIATSTRKTAKPRLS